MKFGSFVLVKLHDTEKLIPATKVLAACDSVIHWHAVDGQANLVIKLNTPNLPEEIHSLDGLAELRDYVIVGDDEKGISLQPGLCYAYAFLEVEPEKETSVLASIEQIEAVTYCARLQNGSDIVAVVGGNNFDSVDGLILGRIRGIDGVLRLRNYHIIKLTNLH
jgi:hypothetical protein